MRVSINMIYGQPVDYMNNALGKLLRLNEQNANQKRLNAPSDDGAGYGRMLDLTSHVALLEQYQENIDTASGWLDLADGELQSAGDLTIRLQELAEQASTGTLTDDQRETIAEEARQIMHQLVTTANAEYAGDSIFAGTEIDGNAYTLGLGATVSEGGETLDSSVSLVETVTGSASSTVYVEFENDGTVGTDALTYRWSSDGGDTWQTDTLAAGDTTLEMDGVRVDMVAGATVTASPEAGDGEGTAMYIRPAAYYQGDDNDGAEVSHYGQSVLTPTVTGTFEDKVVIRVDSTNTVPGPIEYSYSTDGGSTWVTGRETTDGVFTVPGGHVELTPVGNIAYEDDQFVIRPHEADMDVEISSSSTVTINSVGKDIFGGLYVPPGETQAQLADPDSPETNLLETVGEFIGYLETDNQEGVAESLEKLNTAHEHLTTAMGEVGARMVRVEFAEASISRATETITGNISDIQDADVSALSTEIAKTQYIYESVLATSTKIMNLSLLDYM